MVQASLFSVFLTLFLYYFHSAFIVFSYLSLVSESFPLENQETKYSSFPIPQNVSVIGSSQRSIALIWDLPLSDKIIHGYRIFYMHETFKDVKTIRTSSPSYNLTRLEPYTTYTVWVRALVEDNNSSTVVETDKSIAIEAHTDVNEPSAPRIMNVTCFDSGALYIQWKRPLNFDKSVDYYYVYYKREDESLFKHIAIQADSKENNDFVIKELRGIYSYSIKICAGTNSVFDEGKFTWKGSFSQEVSVYLPEQECRQDDRESEKFEFSLGLLIGLLLVLFLLLIAVISFVLWRQYFKAAYYYLEGEPSRVLSTVPLGVPEWGKKSKNSPNGGTHGDEGDDEDDYGSISVPCFAEHVSALHADSDIGFSKEYEEIQKYSAKSVIATHEHSSHPDNKSKNRYLNIVAYDHSRVVLATLSGQKKTSDYINANFIDGFQRFHAYIGTQGPLDETFESFWRMIWEQNCFVIVMITNLMERGRRKCDSYWPKDVGSSESYGFIEVSLVKEDIMANYTLRLLKIKHLKLRKKKWLSMERDIHQFHYTSWPDHGVPNHVLPVLSFIRKSSSCNPTAGGPIIVHCSAGVGRTGTYICIDTMLQEIKAKNELNIYGFLKHIRSQRNYLVQTEEQYVFIHDALLEATRSGNTEIRKDEVVSYISKICRVTDEDPVSILEKQFKLIVAFAPNDFHYMSSRKSYNLDKIRDSSLIPVESSRVTLSPKPGVEGSDYINASWLIGHSKIKEFILTQHPSTTTTSEFWRMLWDHNAQTVVLLSPIVSPDFPIFWPMNEDFDEESFRVRFIDEVVHEGHSTFDLVVSSTHDDYELAVRIIHCPDWSAKGFAVLKLVQDWHLEYQDGPLVVVDKYGGSDAGSFCALTTLCKQLDTDSALDVYQVSKLYHDARPRIWKSKSDVLSLYTAMSELIASNAANPVQSEQLGIPLANGSVIERRHSVSDWQSSNGSLSNSSPSNHRRHSLPGSTPLLLETDKQNVSATLNNGENDEEYKENEEYKDEEDEDEEDDDEIDETAKLTL